jgi:hypothetical protein
MKFLGTDPFMQYIGPSDPQYTTGRTVRLTVPLEYAVGAPDGATVIRCPAGMISDFASIPRFLWPILSPMGWYGKAALLHDDLYNQGKIGNMVISRAYADGVLFEAMRVLEAEKLLNYGAKQSELRDWLERRAIYWGVRLGGWATWNGYRSRESAAAR